MRQRPVPGTLTAVRATALVAVLTLSACAPALPPGPRPIAGIRVPIPAGANPSGGSSPRTGAAGRGGHLAANCPMANCLTANWWTLFQDADLDRLVVAAVAANPGLAEARARVRAAQARVAGADAALLPHIDGDARVSRLRNSSDGDRAIYNGRTYTLGGLDPLNVNYHLDLWGRDSEAVAAATADAEVERARSAQSRLLLTAAVIKTYFAWRTAADLINHQRALVDLAGRAETIEAAAVAAGVAPDAAPVADAAGRQQALARLAHLDQKATALGYALRALLGGGPDTTLPTPRPLDGEGVTAYPLPATITLETLAARPDIRMALWGVRAAGHRQALARIAYYPNINLHALAGLTSIGMDDLLRAGSLGYAFGPTLSLPLFEGGALDAGLRASAAGYAAAVHAYDKTVLDAAAQVATDLAGLDNGRETWERDEESRRLAARLAAIAEAGYRSGVGDQLAPVRAGVRLEGAAMSSLEGRLAWLDAMTDTATDLGGGSQTE